LISPEWGQAGRTRPPGPRGNRHAALARDSRTAINCPAVPRTRWAVAPPVVPRGRCRVVAWTVRELPMHNAVTEPSVRCFAETDRLKLIAMMREVNPESVICGYRRNR